MKAKGIGFCHAMKGRRLMVDSREYEEMLAEKQSSPASRLGGCYHEFDTRDMHTTTVYTVFLNVRGVPTKMLVECRSLAMMERG
jgi:hypothetical protein